MGDEDIELVPEPPHATAGHRRARHRAVHWAVLMFNVVAVLACFVGAGILIVGQQFLTQTQKSAAIQAPPTQVSSAPIKPASATNPPGGSTVTIVDNTTGTTIAAGIPTTTEPFPQADPQAQNFLITGSDNRACPDANTANPVPNRDTLGERSDTIMIMRVDPSTSRAAVLSFPRDLWVKIDGSNSKSRINSAYVLNDPQKMINTIYANFGVPIQHSIQVDFCAFKTLVDAVGGVSVYFNYPAQDPHTGLNVDVTDGCYTFNGDAALAYVRSRHYLYLDPKTGTFIEDPASDYGRISRQQDFLRRAVAKILSKGFDLSLARSLIDVAKNYVVVDQNLTVEKELQFAGVLKSLDPQTIQTYQIEGVGQVIGGAAVIVPKLTGDNMKSILAIFKGQAQLATAPVQVFESTTTSVEQTTTTAAPSTTSLAPTTTIHSGTTIAGQTGTTTTPRTTTTTTTTSSSTTTTVGPTTTTSSLPQTSATEITRGIVPPKDKTCP
jgi:LCP family protein required for cell wall assembly